MHCEPSQQTLSISDNLNLLETQIPEIPEDIIFPDELNRYLRDKVQYLTHENCMLRKNLNEYEERINQSQNEINNLNNRINGFSSEQSFLTASGATSSKIVELSKKIREKTAEVEVLKTKCAKLEKNLLQLTENQDNNLVPVKQPKPVNEMEDQIKSLHDKLNTTTAKLFETKNLNVQLKNELKVANKILQQEVGESFESLQSMIGTNSNWRGRAQLICDLQQKNNELREKLKDKGPEVNSSGDSNNIVRNRVDKRVDQLTKENKELKQALENSTRKIDGLRARCKVLESECNTSKTKLSSISEQSERDRELVTVLMARISNAKEEQNDVIKHKQQIILKLEEEIKNLKLQLEKANCINSNLKKNAECQHSFISDYSIRPCSRCSSINNSKDKDSRILEIEKSRLLELTELLNKKLEKERNDHLITQQQLRTERQKAAKFEAKVARLQLENSDKCSTYSGYSTISRQTKSTLQDQLELAEENIKALQTRLEIERHERKLDFQEFSKIVQNYKDLEL